MKLTKQQIKVINHSNGHGLAQAGSGCGKTSTLFELINQQSHKHKFLALTYNKTTQVDFEDKIKKRINGDTNCVDVFTFHGFGFSLIKRFYKTIGFTGKVRKSKKVHFNRCLSKIASEYKINPKELKQCYYSKEEGLRPGNLSRAKEKLSQCYRSYKLKHNLVDFDDMIALGSQLLDNKKVIKKLVNDYDYLLVDELQDIDMLQATFIYKLASAIGTSLLVGDKKQSIYGFRGSDPKYWLELEQQLKPTHYELTESFRLPKQSLGVVNSVGKLICDDAPLISNRKGYKPVYCTFTDSDKQLAYITEQVEMLRQKGIEYNEIACIARTNAQLRHLRLGLSHRGIPCIEEQYSDSAVETCFQWMRCLLRIASFQKKVIDEFPVRSLHHIVEMLKLDDDARNRLINDVINNGWNAFMLQRSHKKYSQARVIRNAVVDAASTDDLEQAVQILLDVIKPIIRKRFSKQIRYQVVRELSSIKLEGRKCSWETLNVSRIKSLAVKEDAVRLITMHSAKGKEWRVVFLLHVVEGNIPFYTNQNLKESNIQEQTRLFYVSITRHKERLFILKTPVTRQIPGKHRNRLLNKESCFIADIKAHLITGKP